MAALLKETDSRLDFVVLANCHSEFAAKLFLETCDHVIAIRSDATLLDEAAITFT